MAEPRGNHLDIDGGQVKEDVHTASYKPIPENDSELRKSKSSLVKSKEKLSPDGAEEKLLDKETEAKIATRIDMADAKFVVADHRNGDAKIEIDANKRQFAGLTKEELMKFADDPFWVRLRWFMFILFWVLWLSMLAGAIAIIFFAPKCSAPAAKTWFEKGPLIDTTPAFLSDVVQKPDLLPNIQTIGAQGLIVSQDEPYAVLDDEKALDEIKSLVTRAAEYSVKVIVDLSASFVLSDHKWFQLAVNRSGEYADYFIWADTKINGSNNWVSKVNTPAWTFNPQRNQYYYHQYAENKPQLNFDNPTVVRCLDDVIKKYLATGVAGIRLDARELLVDKNFTSEEIQSGNRAVAGADHTQYAFWQHRHTSDLPALVPLLQHWSHVVDNSTGGDGNTVFTITESGGRPEWYLKHNNTNYLRRPSAAPVNMKRSAADVANELRNKVETWTLLELTQPDSSNLEVAAFALVLPATPVFKPIHFTKTDNASKSALSEFARLTALRQDASINHGNTSITAVPAHNTTEELLVCARWKSGHTGYAAVWNPSEELLTADLSSVPALPSSVTVYYASKATAIDVGKELDSTKLAVPPLSTLILSYVPKTVEEK